MTVHVYVTQHLTFHMIIRVTNNTSGKSFKLKMLHCRAIAFTVGTTTDTENAHVYESHLGEMFVSSCSCIGSKCASKKCMPTV